MIRIDVFIGRNKIIEFRELPPTAEEFQTHMPPTRQDVTQWGYHSKLALILPTNKLKEVGLPCAGPPCDKNNRNFRLNERNCLLIVFGNLNIPRRLSGHLGTPRWWCLMCRLFIERSCVWRPESEDLLNGVN